MFTIIGGDQKQYGPVSADEVRQWIRDGRADGRTLARTETDSEWKPLSAFPEFSAFTAAPGTPPKLSSATPALLTNEQLLAGEPDLHLGHCLGRGWELLTANFGLFIGATTIIWMLEMAVSVIPFAGIFLGGVLHGGLYLVYLKRVRGQPSTVGEAFSGFSAGFLQLLLAGFLSTLLASIAYIFCMAPWVYFKIAWLFCLPLVIDKRLEFWTAMELSRKVVSRVWFKVFCLAVIAFAPTILFKGYVYIKSSDMMYSAMMDLLGHGSPDPAKLFALIIKVARDTAALNLAAQFVLLINLPFATAALMYAYEDLFGPRPAPAA